MEISPSTQEQVTYLLTLTLLRPSVRILGQAICANITTYLQEKQVFAYLLE